MSGHVDHGQAAGRVGAPLAYPSVKRHRHRPPPRPAYAIGCRSARDGAVILAGVAAGPETDPPPPSAGDGGAAAHLHGPSRLFANVIPLSTAGEPDVVDPATASGTRHGRDDDEHGVA